MTASREQMKALTFDEFRRANVARGIKWQPAGIASWSPSDWLTAVTGELGELASLLKMRNRERDGLPGNKFSPTDKQVADEIADVLTYLDLLAEVLGVNLGQAAASKFNEVSERVGFPDRIELHPGQQESASQAGQRDASAPSKEGRAAGPAIAEPTNRRKAQRRVMLIARTGQMRREQPDRRIAVREAAAPYAPPVNTNIGNPQHYERADSLPNAPARTDGWCSCAPLNCEDRQDGICHYPTDSPIKKAATYFHMIQELERELAALRRPVGIAPHSYATDLETAAALADCETKIADANKCYDELLADNRETAAEFDAAIAEREARIERLQMELGDAIKDSAHEINTLIKASNQRADDAAGVAMELAARVCFSYCQDATFSRKHEAAAIARHLTESIRSQITSARVGEIMCVYDAVTAYRKSSTMSVSEFHAAIDAAMTMGQSK